MAMVQRRANVHTNTVTVLISSELLFWAKHFVI